METSGLNLEGIPEPIARSLEIVAQMARNLSTSSTEIRRKDELPLWPGTVIGSLDREVIYGEQDEHAA
ncbi:MAG: hypothetical protein IT426_04730 [Pirellulales bacterium]|nr:hypothetical protein [Pirellulales bacterium]